MKVAIVKESFLFGKKKFVKDTLYKVEDVLFEIINKDFGFSILEELKENNDSNIEEIKADSNQDASSKEDEIKSLNIKLSEKDLEIENLKKSSNSSKLNEAKLAEKDLEIENLKKSKELIQSNLDILNKSDSNIEKIVSITATLEKWIKNPPNKENLMKEIVEAYNFLTKKEGDN